MNMQATQYTSSQQLESQSPIFQVPHIGRRTSKILYAAGVKTVAQFLALPDLLLESTFGPSLPRLKRQTRRLLSDPSVPQSRRALVARLAQFVTA